MCFAACGETLLPAKPQAVSGCGGGARTIVRGLGEYAVEGGFPVRILVADDSAVGRYLLQAYLEEWGYEAAYARDGAEAWRLFQEGDFPIVLSDWVMPEMDGLELIRLIRASKRRGYVYIILLTARSEKNDLVQGMEAGADDFMTKPPDEGELRVRLRAGERIIQLEERLEAQNRALRDAQAALVQNEKLASLGRLAAGVAHEVNNPLAYVTNNLAVLRRDLASVLDVLDAYRRAAEAAPLTPTPLPPGERGRGEGDQLASARRLEEETDLAYFRATFGRTCDKSLEGLQRVRNIVSNLRDFARLDEAELKDADLNSAFESAVEVLGHEIRRKQIHLERDLRPLPPVLCHPGKINQVFLNLIVNAVQACEPGGTVTLRSRAEDGRVVAEVEDNGCGIALEHRPRLFEPFFTTRPIGQGTGLGLAVSFGIVRDHGGAIEVESTVGRGSTFRVRLPLRPPLPPANEAPR
jgi:two-component system, NtrC family, sensor kinase